MNSGAASTFDLGNYCCFTLTAGVAIVTVVP